MFSYQDSDPDSLCYATLRRELQTAKRKSAVYAANFTRTSTLVEPFLCLVKKVSAPTKYTCCTPKHPSRFNKMHIDPSYKSPQSFPHSFFESDYFANASKYSGFAHNAIVLQAETIAMQAARSIAIAISYCHNPSSFCSSNNNAASALPLSYNRISTTPVPVSENSTPPLNLGAHEAPSACWASQKATTMQRLPSAIPAMLRLGGGWQGGVA